MRINKFMNWIINIRGIMLIIDIIGIQFLKFIQ